MRKVDNLTSDADQTTRITLDDGSIVTMRFVYDGTVQRWRLNVSRGAVSIEGINVCVHPNLLRQFRRNITFGLAVAAADQVDPVYIDDFANGRVTVYILEQDDVDYVENNLLGATA